MKKINVYIITAMVVSILLLNFVESTRSTEQQDFEVHEWGVFLKGYDCNDTFVWTNPSDSSREYIIAVDKPVIYFHSSENLTNVTVNVGGVKNATTIPNATMEDNSILWNVSVENNTVIASNGTDYPYLFYEGEIIYLQTIIANVTIKECNAIFYVRNIANYTISDLFFIYDGIHGYSGEYPDETIKKATVSFGWAYIQIDKLDANEEKTISVPLKYNSSYNLSALRESSVGKGLTEVEVQEMLDYWEYYWFNYSYLSSNTEIGGFLPPYNAKIIYTTPQSVYDQLLPLSISPQPNVTKRVGIFTITNIPVIWDYTYNEEEESAFPVLEVLFIIGLFIFTVLYLWKFYKKHINLRSIIGFLKPEWIKITLFLGAILIHLGLNYYYLMIDYCSFRFLPLLYTAFNLPLALFPSTSLWSFSASSIDSYLAHSGPLILHFIYAYFVTSWMSFIIRQKNKEYKYRDAFVLISIFFAFLIIVLICYFTW